MFVVVRHVNHAVQFAPIIGGERKDLRRLEQVLNNDGEVVVERRVADGERVQVETQQWVHRRVVRVQLGRWCLRVYRWCCRNRYCCCCRCSWGFQLFSWDYLSHLFEYEVVDRLSLIAQLVNVGLLLRAQVTAYGYEVITFLNWNEIHILDFIIFFVWTLG